MNPIDKINTVAGLNYPIPSGLAGGPLSCGGAFGEIRAYDVRREDEGRAFGDNLASSDSPS